MTTEPPNTELPNPDFKSIWRDQPTESLAMPVAEIRARAERFQFKGRLVLTINYVNAALIAAAFGWGVVNARNGFLGAGCAFMVLFALVFAGWNRQRRPGRMPTPESSGRAIVDFHRRELERAKIRFKTLALLVLPALLGVVLIAAGAYASRPGSGALKSLAPIALLLAAWIAIAWFRRRQSSRKLQRQIDELDAVRLE